MNHPRLLAFGYTYMPCGGRELCYGLVNASRLEGFQARTYDLADVTLTDVHHISADDVFALTDIVWNSKTDSIPYGDRIAHESFERQGLR